MTRVCWSVRDRSDVLLARLGLLAGRALFLIANLAFGASIVVYNSFLPEIAEPEERDNVSSKGWGFGYLGGGIVLALNLALFSNAAKLGLTEGLAVRISLASAGLWWALFTLVPLLGLKNDRPDAIRGAGEGLGSGFRQLFQTIREMRRYPQTLTFLIAYLNLQRCRTAGDNAIGPVRQRRVENPDGHIDHGDSDGAVPRLRGRAAVQRDLQQDRNQAGDRIGSA